MKNILFETFLNVSYQKVHQGFNRDLFIHLGPQWAAFELERFDGCLKGDEIHLQIKLMGLKQRWVSQITHEGEDETGWSFIDEGKVMPWPLSYWKHNHKIVKVSESSCKIIDDIKFEAFSPILGKMLYPILWSTFAIRPKLYKDFFEANL